MIGQSPDLVGHRHIGMEKSTRVALGPYLLQSLQVGGREKTERPEAVDAGTSRLVGTDPVRIIEECSVLLDDAVEYDRRSRIHNPYGDGKASERIAEALQRYFQLAV